MRPGSLADLISRYKASLEWDEKAEETKRDYKKALTPLEMDYGTRPVVGIQKRHVLAIRDHYAWRMEPDPDKPGEERRVPNVRQANRVVTVLSILLTYAVDNLGWRQDNPALRPKRLKAKGDDYRPWTQEEFQQFMERSPEDWRFAALLALLTAQRGQDLVRMRLADYDGSAVALTPLKTKCTSKTKLRIEIHPMLKPELDARKAAARRRSPAPLLIIARPDGTAWPVNAFQKAAGVAIRDAGLSGTLWHGLRSTAASWAADGGATEEMLKALLGHRTGRMSQHYARGANQRRMAAAAVQSIMMPGKIPTRQD